MPLARCAGPRSDAELEESLRRLEEGARERMLAAFAPKSKGAVQSVIRAFARFADCYPTLELFRAVEEGRGRGAASAHNEWVLILFIHYLSAATSRKTKKPLSAKSIRSYVSLLKSTLSFRFGFPILDNELRLKHVVRDLLQRDPLAGVRKKRRGWRRHHFEQLVQRGAYVRGDATLRNELNRFACVSTAWQTLARGGEVTNGAKSGWSAERDPSRADLTFHTAGSVRYAVLMLRPLKKRGQALQPKIPQYIAEHDGGPSDTYTALVRLVRLDPVEPALRAATPLFRLRGEKGVRPMLVEDVRNTIRAYAAAIGYTTPSEWGAHSARIGGATDLCSQGSCSEVLLAAKGRWASDIGKIYARMTRRAQLKASRLMQAARGRCVEELMPGFTQAA